MSVFLVFVRNGKLDTNGIPYIVAGFWGFHSSVPSSTYVVHAVKKDSHSTELSPSARSILVHIA